jgi:hypothetical protein
MVDELLFEDYTDSFYPATPPLLPDSGGPPIYLNPKVLEIADWLKTKMVKEPNKLSDSSALYSCLKMLQAQDYFYKLTESYPKLKFRKARDFPDFILEEFNYEVEWVGGGRTSDKVFEKVSLLKNFFEPINSALVQTHLYRFRRYEDSEKDLWMLNDINSDWVFAPNLFVLKPPSMLPSFMNWNKTPF